jgi:outer membrane protein OmpA-like peptidoglycan-associated protein
MIINLTDLLRPCCGKEHIKIISSQVELTMQIKYLTIALAIALASVPALAASKATTKTKQASATAAPTATKSAATYPVAGSSASDAYKVNMVQVPAGQIPQTPEQWLGRMGDFTQNASAFKDPKAFEAWMAAMTNPSMVTAAIPVMMEPGNMLHMVASGMQPGAMNNYMGFMDPSMYMRWTGAMMDPNFYMRTMGAFSDPNKMMQWAMLPMSPKLWESGMVMMNPNSYMKWMMAPTDPRAMNMMFAPMNPQMYGSMMGTVINPSMLGSNWNTFMKPVTPAVPFGPAAPVTLPINVMDPSTWMNMMNMFGGMGGGGMMPFGGMGGAPAQGAAPMGFAIPGFGTANNPYLASAQGAPAAPSFFQPGVPARLSLSGDTLFHSGKASTKDLTAEGKKSLDELANKIKVAGSIDTIKVTGHADKTGKASSNMKLSLARARSVADYLKSKGVKAAKFITAGKGDTQPVKDCDMKLPKADLIACLQPNRRVEVEVTPAK